MGNALSLIFVLWILAKAGVPHEFFIWGFIIYVVVKVKKGEW